MCTAGFRDLGNHLRFLPTTGKERKGRWSQSYFLRITVCAVSLLSRSSGHCLGVSILEPTKQCPATVSPAQQGRLKKYERVMSLISGSSKDSQGDDTCAGI